MDNAWGTELHLFEETIVDSDPVVTEITENATPYTCTEGNTTDLGLTYTFTKAGNYYLDVMPRSDYQYRRTLRSITFMDHYDHVDDGYNGCSVEGCDYWTGKNTVKVTPADYDKGYITSTFGDGNKTYTSDLAAGNTWHIRTKTPEVKANHKYRFFIHYSQSGLNPMNYPMTILAFNNDHSSARVWQKNYTTDYFGNTENHPYYEITTTQDGYLYIDMVNKQSYKLTVNTIWLIEEAVSE